MGIIFLPSEIYHREFDYKLALSVHLASLGNYVIVGYDKHFHSIIRASPPGALLEKSASTVMFNGRIKPTVNNGGQVIVNDEEGFNNLHEEHKNQWLNRVDPRSIEAIHSYLSWGQYDYSFFSRIKSLKEKMIVAGNCRRDLLEDFGREFYADEVEAIRNLYGDCLLFIDNFCVECWRTGYKPPAFAVSEYKNKEAYKEYVESIAEQSEAREYFAEFIHQAARAFPSRQIIIRPHPVADPRWWQSKFWSYRNVHIIFHHSIEPWIHACSALISMGCTTAIQAVIANRPVIEIQHRDPSSALHGFASALTDFIADTPSSLLKIIRQLPSSYNLSDSQLEYLNKLWRPSQAGLTLVKYSMLLNKLAPQISSNHHSMLVKTLTSYRNSINSRIDISDEKWAIPPFSSILKKANKVSRILNIPEPNVHKLATCLYLVSPANS